MKAPDSSEVSSLAQPPERTSLAQPPVEEGLPWAVAVVIWRCAEVLMIRRSQHVPLPGYWTPVTGKVEPGESLDLACIREVSEELGLEVAVGAPFHEGLTSNQKYRLVYHEADYSGGVLTPAPLEVEEARWLDPEQALQLSPMLETTRAILKVHFETRLSRFA